MSEIPAEIAELVRLRDEARAAKDFARADALRDEIAAVGYLLQDTPSGAVVEPAPAFEPVDPATLEPALDQAPELEFSFHLLYEGFVRDVERFLEGLERHNDVGACEVVLVDNASDDGKALEEIAAERAWVRVVHLDHELGWAAARNAGLKGARGRIVVLVDLSIEPAGECLAPLRAAFAGDGVACAGPFGLRSESMRDWEPSEGPEVDALEGYFLAFRRSALRDGFLHEKFKWYRNADIDFSFQLRSGGARAQVIPLPLVKHAHRGWEAVPEPERAKRSKRNHYIFFGRWKHRHDLLLSHREERA